jgi:hypothetical protein
MLRPGPSPYPTTKYPALDGIIQQPQFLAPVQQSAADEIVISDNQAAREPVQPPGLLPTTAPRKFNPPAAAAQPTRSARFRALILGPSQASTAAQNAKASHFGGSLIGQLLGAGADAPPRPRPADRDTKLADIPLANQLMLASAEVESDAPVEQRKPTVRDVEAAKTPAASMSIARPGWKEQLGLPVAPAASSAPPIERATDSGMVPVPSVPNGLFGRIAGELWRPFGMTTDAPTTSMPEDDSTSTVQTAQLPESERVPSLLRPFYVTNPPAPGEGGGAANLASTDTPPQSLADVFVQSSLGRQLALANNQDLRTPLNASIDAQVRHDQQPWDGRVTVQWPLLANPFTLSDVGPPAAIVGGDVAQVAYLEEPLPAPAGSGAAPDDVGLPASKDNSSNDQDQSDEAKKAGKKKDEKETLVGAKTIGTAPVDNTLDFLRTSTVLLAPGKSQFDIGFEYTLTENDFPILITDGMGTVVGVDNVEFKGRELTVPMELRYGLLNRVQGFLQVPVGWANVQAAINNFDEFENDGGIGDVGFGLTAQLKDAYKDCPYLIGTLAGLAPSGGDPFGVVGTISPNAPSLGNGFWAISGNLLWVQTRYDPVVVFYGFGARYQFAHDYIGVEFQPGTEYNYTLGAGFAVNERVTLSTQFFGAYIGDLKANGDRLEGTAQEPMTIRMAATLAKPCNRIVEPFVAFGLTDDSISANFGITWTY